MRASKEEEIQFHEQYIPRKHYENFLLGSCEMNTTWPDCEVSCSIDHLGEGCFFKYHQLTKNKYYVCRKEQNWLFFLYCNGTTDLPISSCHGKRKIYQLIIVNFILYQLELC